jgi:acyl-coenzyme A thioesterase PaaI-like protein
MRSLLPSSEKLDNLKISALINAYCAVNIPLLAFVTPRVIALTDDRAEVRVRLDRRSRNHLGVMYFGALAMGAELSIALKALTAIQRSGKKIDFIFKDFSGEFLKRADGHVHFVCAEAAGVQDLINRAAASSERISETFSGFAYVPSAGDEPVMKYKLTLSVKQKVRKT